MKKLIFLSLLLAACACASGPNSYQKELESYHWYLQEEITAGRLTIKQAEYLQAVKETELNERARGSHSAAAAAYGLTGAALLNAGAPRPAGVPLNCSSIQQGAFYNTRCF